MKKLLILLSILAAFNADGQLLGIGARVIGAGAKAVRKKKTDKVDQAGIEAGRKIIYEDSMQNVKNQIANKREAAFYDSIVKVRAVQKKIEMAQRWREDSIKSHDNMVAQAISDSIRIVENAREEKAANDAEAARKKALIKKYGVKYGNLIYEGKVLLGMTKKMCLDSWGEPEHTSTSIAAGILLEVWLYADYSLLSFRSGILVTINN